MNKKHWVYNSYDSPCSPLVFKEGFPPCWLKIILVCFICDLFCRYMHKVFLPTYFLSFSDSFVGLLAIWLPTHPVPYAWLTKVKRSITPLWLLTPNHSSRPSSRSLYWLLSLSSSASLLLHTLFLYICIWGVFLFCSVFLTCSVHLYYCDVLSSSLVKKKKKYLFECFIVSRCMCVDWVDLC